MERPLVWKLPNSMIRPLPGIWNSSPGESRMNSTSPMNTGAQSAMALLSLTQGRAGSFQSVLWLVSKPGPGVMERK
ncbi:hypothetical protein EJB05_47528, partial [Eragrostis curvula]